MKTVLMMVILGLSSAAFAKTKTISTEHTVILNLTF